MVSSWLSRLGNVLEKILIVISMLILVALASIIILAVFGRFLGASLHWYDEVSAILLAWLTFYGSALVALRRSHMGFEGLVASMPLMARRLLFITSELIVIGFFAVMAWAGFYVLQIFGDETISSLDFITLAMAQSALPIGAALFVLAQLCSLPDAWKQMCSGKTQEEEEIEQAIRDAEKDMAVAMEGAK